MKLNWSGKIVFWGCLWGFGFLILAILLDPTPENYTLGISILLSGSYTWLLSKTRNLWVQRLSKKPIRNAILIGSLNAAVVETIFLIAEKSLGASGVAAHPNILIDLLLTMPWYIGMVWIFVRVQYREQFPAGVVLLLGAIYELGADGIIGGLILPAIMGTLPNILEYTILMGLGMFWQFIPVYSSIVLPPAWVLDQVEQTELPNQKQWIRGLLPLVLLIPFTIYLVLFIGVLGALGG